MKKLFLILILVFSFCLTGCNETTVVANQIDVNDIVINKSYAYVDVGEKLILTAQVYPFNADNQNILWKSDNSNIAEVSGGIVIGKSEGRTVITCISEDGEKEDKCILYVSTPKLDYKKYKNNLTNSQNNFKNNILLSQNEENNLDENQENVVEDNYDLENNFEKENKNVSNFLELINDEIEKVDEMFKSIKNFNDEVFNSFKKEQFYETNVSDEKTNFYAYEYKYNSNGIDEEEDENTIYKDENTIVREFCN